MAHFYSDALRSLVPKAKLSIMNEDYATLQWDESNTDTKPTKAELDADAVRCRVSCKKISKDREQMIPVKKCLVFKQVIQNWRTT